MKVQNAFTTGTSRRVFTAGAISVAAALALSACPDTGQSSADPLAGGQIRAGDLAGGQIRAEGWAPGALICTRGAAAAVWVLPGTPLPRAAPQLTPVSIPPSDAPGSAP